ncbi:Thiol:disulfide interchange protein DsbD precursor [Leclercia adecarboxylata]|uniref:Thiol:disulfide interchange protein DsbD n=1 Tax=Leclercia adecarboxylata TaxID=83655 RepID=A0A4U9HKL1_9ENTR|nr:Thiol:disulfide interchange protein DsbD precursor [Leclercia adecarboxylata]
MQNALKETVLLQANVTANSPQGKALLKELNVLGLPTILVFQRPKVKSSPHSG